MNSNKNFTVDDFISKYSDKIIENVDSFANIKSEKDLVYIVTYEDIPIVVGSGKKERAIKTIKGNHIKSIFLQIYKKYGIKEKLRYYYIETKDKKEAKEIERNAHIVFGGDSRAIKPEVLSNFEREYKKYPHIEKYIKQALLSSYDGLSDLRVWYANEIITDEEWKDIKKIFDISEKKSKKKNPLGNSDNWKNVLEKLKNGVTRKLS
ncbi:MAG: hypothetical protein IKS15_01000 [Opitutales bacterium]|nr:hypothetical protein [Opitutales bacterium]